MGSQFQDTVPIMVGKERQLELEVTSPIVSAVGKQRVTIVCFLPCPWNDATHEIEMITHRVAQGLVSQVILDLINSKTWPFRSPA